VIPSFAPITFGRERWSSGSQLSRHRHEQGYICLVLSGGFEEAGDCGRRIVRAGDVNFHGPFDAHRDRFLGAGAETINFALPDWMDTPVAFGRVHDPDLIARAAERDYEAARQLLLSMVEPVRYTAHDWPDELATDIRNQSDLCLSAWAEHRGMAPASVSRGFRRAYEVSPSAFRAQIRARRAWRSLVTSNAPLAAVALESGFADQAHMTRTLTALTGRGPTQWRRMGQIDSRLAAAARAGLGHAPTSRAFPDCRSCCPDGVPCSQPICR
jgi:AraC-like DNA-binding protein